MARIAIVEDEPDLLSLYRIVLEKAGHVVVEAISEPKFLDGDLAVLFGSADVLILDERLGTVSGTSYLPAIRAARPGLRVLVATADPEAILKARGLGADEVRKKPFPLRQLCDDVARLLGPTAG